MQLGRLLHTKPRAVSQAYLCVLGCSTTQPSLNQSHLVPSTEKFPESHSMFVLLLFGLLAWLCFLCNPRREALDCPLPQGHSQSRCGPPVVQSLQAASTKPSTCLPSAQAWGMYPEHVLCSGHQAQPQGFKDRSDALASSRVHHWTLSRRCLVTPCRAPSQCPFQPAHLCFIISKSLQIAPQLPVSSSPPLPPPGSVSSSQVWIAQQISTSFSSSHLKATAAPSYPR